MHAGVRSDATAGCSSEGWTSDVYQRIFLAAQDAVIWQGANRFVASRSLVEQHPKLHFQPSREIRPGVPIALRVLSFLATNRENLSTSAAARPAVAIL